MSKKSQHLRKAVEVGVLGEEAVRIVPRQEYIRQDLMSKGRGKRNKHAGVKKVKEEENGNDLKKKKKKNKKKQSTLNQPMENA